MTGINRTPKGLVIFLREAARYFANRDTGGEDKAYWANVYNSENCDAAADLIEKELVK
jgi:hypothetical protein